MDESAARQAAVKRLQNNSFGPGPGIGPNKGGYVPQYPNSPNPRKSRTAILRGSPRYNNAQGQRRITSA